MYALEDKVEDAIDVVSRDFVGLPWDIDPAKCKESDWRPVPPGTYYFNKIENGWVYIRQGSVMLKMDEGDVRARFNKDRGYI